MSKEYELIPGQVKGYVCLFKIDGHRTFRITHASSVKNIEKQLKNALGKHKVTEKKFFEIDRITGSFEEF